MDGFQIWHWHPVFVRFTVGLLAIAPILFTVSWWNRQKPWARSCLAVARWNLSLGLAAALFTAYTGGLAYMAVPHNVSEQPIMNAHALAAVSTFAVYGALFFWNWRQRRKEMVSLLFTGVSLAGLALLVATGYFGGRLVFHYGVGVQAVYLPPEASRTRGFVEENGL